MWRVRFAWRPPYLLPCIVSPHSAWCTLRHTGLPGSKLLLVTSLGSSSCLIDGGAFSAHNVCVCVLCRCCIGLARCMTQGSTAC
jgi:hypothetical protein